MENLKKFENNNLVLFKALQSIVKQKKELEEQERSIKENLEIQMKKFDVKSLDNDYIKITSVSGSVSETIDLKTLEEKENELYKELLKDYPKTTVKKSYISFKVK
nr:MAG TPA: hypothetical protein [Caudoviricetes sp.]